jgi:hypothetical protein
MIAFRVGIFASMYAKMVKGDVGIFIRGDGSQRGIRVVPMDRVDSDMKGL